MSGTIGRGTPPPQQTTAPATATTPSSPSKRAGVKPMSDAVFASADPSHQPAPQPAAANTTSGPPTPSHGVAPPPAEASSASAPQGLTATLQDHEAAVQLRAMIPMLHPAMVGAVLQSLVDDMPWLATVVRSRCEVAMSLTSAAAASAAAVAFPFAGAAATHHHVPNAAAAPFFPAAMQPQVGTANPYAAQHAAMLMQSANPAAFSMLLAQQQQQHMLASLAAGSQGHAFGGGHSELGGTTPNSMARRAAQQSSRGGGASPNARGMPSGTEENDVCSVHGTMRSRKHLHINPNNRMKECIPGFHCLESGSAFQTPTKPAARDAAAAHQHHGGSGSNPPTPQSAAAAAAKAEQLANPPIDEAEVKRLQDLLTSVRQSTASS
jgi:hypothetical protein